MTIRKKKKKKEGKLLKDIPQSIWELRNKSLKKSDFVTFGKLLGSSDIIVSVWSFVASLATLLLTHSRVNSNFPWPSLNAQCYYVF